jgi:DNA-binding transcriptional regulator LsrR (DeoR family)
MGARESEAMKRARELVIAQGLSQAEAARRTGLTRGAISKAAWYREWKIKLEDQK